MSGIERWRVRRIREGQSQGPTSLGSQVSHHLSGRSLDMPLASVSYVFSSEDAERAGDTPSAKDLASAA